MSNIALDTYLSRARRSLASSEFYYFRLVVAAFHLSFNWPGDALRRLLRLVLSFYWHCDIAMHIEDFWSAGIMITGVFRRMSNCSLYSFCLSEYSFPLCPSALMMERMFRLVDILNGHMIQKLLSLKADKRHQRNKTWSCLFIWVFLSPIQNFLASNS